MQERKTESTMNEEKTRINPVIKLDASGIDVKLKTPTLDEIKAYVDNSTNTNDLIPPQEFGYRALSATLHCFPSQAEQQYKRPGAASVPMQGWAVAKTLMMSRIQAISTTLLADMLRSKQVRMNVNYTHEFKFLCNLHAKTTACSVEVTFSLQPTGIAISHISPFVEGKNLCFESHSYKTMRAFIISYKGLELPEDHW